MGSFRDHRVTLLLTALSIAVGMCWSMLFIPLLKDLPQWWISPEVWVPLQGAHFVANGALGYVYESTPFLVTLPGLPIVLAPVAAVGEWLQLGESRPMVLAYPSIWLIYGPVGIGMSAILFAGSRKALLTSAVKTLRQRSWVLEFTLFILVVVPTAVVYGHYEDVVATGLVLFSVAAFLRGRGDKAALLLAASILFKQWAVLALPALIAGTLPGRRVRFALITLLPPAAMSAFLLAIDWEHASQALLAAPSYLGLGHAAPWTSGLDGRLVSTPFRILAFLPALIATRRVRPGMKPEILVAAVAFAFIGRLLFEPMVLAYYLAPGLAFLALHEGISKGRCRRTLLLGVPLLLWFPVHPETAIWWAVAAAFSIPLTWPAVREIFRSDRGKSPRVVAAPLESA